MGFRLKRLQSVAKRVDFIVKGMALVHLEMINGETFSLNAIAGESIAGMKERVVTELELDTRKASTTLSFASRKLDDEELVPRGPEVRLTLVVCKIACFDLLRLDRLV